MATTLPYDKGYRVYIDGKETPLLRVNTSFVGAKVAAGEHEVVITYDAPGFFLGKCISLCGLLLLIAGILIDRKKRKQNNENLNKNTQESSSEKL